jgi:hypothetical protein
MFFKCPAKESHLKFSVTNQMNKEHWEGTTNAGTSLQHATRPKMCNTDGDGNSDLF